MASSVRLNSFFSFSLRPFLSCFPSSTSTLFSLCSLTTPREPLLRPAFYSTHSRPRQLQRSFYRHQQLRTHLHSFHRPSHSKLFSTSSTPNMRVIPVPVLEGKSYTKPVRLILGSLRIFTPAPWDNFKHHICYFATQSHIWLVAQLFRHNRKAQITDHGKFRSVNFFAGNNLFPG